MFSALAQRVQVRVQEMNVLMSEGIDTADEFYFRLQSPEALEKYLKDVMFLSIGKVGEDGVVTLEARIAPADVDEFLRSSVVSAVRKLWHAAKELSIQDLKNLSDQAIGISDTKPKQVNITLLNDLRARARSRGITDNSDRIRVGNLCLTKVLNNYQPLNGAFVYLELEEFTSAEEETFLLSMGVKPKNMSEVKLVKGDKDVLQTVQADPMAGVQKANIVDGQLVLLQDAFELKARAHDVADVCGRATLDALHQVYLTVVRETPQQGYRVPTFNEIRRFDRLIFRDILRFLSQQQGSLQEGLEFFLSESGRAHPLWKLMEQQMEGTPDKGIDRAPSSLKSEQRPEPSNSSRGRSRSRGNRGKTRRSRTPKKSGGGQCHICGKTRNDHPRRRFCVATAEAHSPPAVAKKRPRDDPKKDKGSSKGSGRSNPPFMKGCAVLEQPSSRHPSGRQFCFDYHDPDKECKHGAAGSGCSRAHTCPKFIKSGTRVCGQNHKVNDHTD